MPARWNGVLVVHAHGGPTLGEPKVERADEDIARWAVLVKAGYAYAASVFRQGGVAVRSAAEDTERVRRIFVAHVAQPRRTILHGPARDVLVGALRLRLAERRSAVGVHHEHAIPLRRHHHEVVGARRILAAQAARPRGNAVRAGRRLRRGLVDAPGRLRARPQQRRCQRHDAAPCRAERLHAGCHRQRPAALHTDGTGASGAACRHCIGTSA